jgi:hypothetical protein
MAASSTPAAAHPIPHVCNVYKKVGLDAFRPSRRLRSSLLLVLNTSGGRPALGRPARPAQCRHAHASFVDDRRRKRIVEDSVARLSQRDA